MPSCHLSWSTGVTEKYLPIWREQAGCALLFFPTNYQIVKTVNQEDTFKGAALSNSSSRHESVASIL